MSNPLMGNNTPSQDINTSANELLQFLNNGGNPEQLAKQIMNKNPQISKGIQQIKNMAGNRSPREFAIQFAKQRGMDPNLIIQVLNKMGLK